MSAQPIFERAAARAEQQQLAYAGAVTVHEAHDLHTAGTATIVDVRTRSEYEQVGHVDRTELFEWRRDGEHQPDPGFAARVLARYRTDEALLLICRSGVRSHYAAEVLTRAGFTRVFNVLDGFEAGWRPAGLPWTR
ncbi:MAG TPA: rhodanese-like domain-containing protein [Usitatibacter sp.]|nr:rhodanese-like domain-containing protein [Usitatibacter sp.]